MSQISNRNNTNYMNSNFQSKFIHNNNIMFNGKSLAKLAIENKKLSVKEFIKKTKYNLEDSYVDKFWHSIENDKDILIDDQIIRWLGFNDEKIFNARSNIKRIIRLNNIDYSMKKYNEILSLKIFSDRNYEYNRINDLKRSKFIMIKSNQFRDLCMMVNTKKGKEIRSYYIKLEELFKNYIKYQQLCDKYFIQTQKLKTLKYIKKINFLEKSIDYRNKEIAELKKKKNKSEFIYIQTNKLYALQGLYKIGRAKNVYARNANLNTSHPIKDKMIIIKQFSVYDSKIAEDRIKFILESIRDSINREFYQGIYLLLEEIIELICDNLNNECERINTIIDKLIQINKCENNYLLDWTRGLDMSIFETEKTLVKQNKETKELIISEDINEETIKKILLFYFNTKTKCKNFATFEELQKSINNYKLIQTSKLKEIDKVNDTIMNKLINIVKEKKWKYKFRK